MPAETGVCHCRILRKNRRTDKKKCNLCTFYFVFCYI